MRERQEERWGVGNERKTGEKRAEKRRKRGRGG